MTGRLHAVLLSAIALVAPATLRGQEVVVPAGTILQCTLNEPNLSSKTAEPGDPVLCDAGPLYVFGVPVLPRGAYLEGHFADFRNPGHFWGKGWMQLEFDRILLPGAEMPLAAKVSSIPHQSVDSQGRIHGKGHATRDAVEWAIPVLWPVKILTLPMRGPRPTLKSETRVNLKLMQSLAIPQSAAGFASDRQQLKPGAFRPAPGSNAPTVNEAVASPPPAEPYAAAPPPDYAADQGTALVLRNGGGLLVKNYWFEDGQRIRYVAFNGMEGLLPIRMLDLGATVRLNRERGIPFMIRSDGNWN
ncbi:MAG TPA: hypothetical protein VGR96_19645 [Acidobacteriaceae bacterium]|nr:hypothetical protein [Acidobacteriaceae bacterium]